MDALLIETEHFLTAFYAIIDIDTFTCRYCSAGHPPQMLVRASGGVELLATTGFFVGMFEGAEYEEAQIQLEPGDRLALYTDGLIARAVEAGVSLHLRSIFLQGLILIHSQKIPKKMVAELHMRNC